VEIAVFLKFQASNEAVRARLANESAKRIQVFFHGFGVLRKTVGSLLTETRSALTLSHKPAAVRAFLRALRWGGALLPVRYDVH
jgi:hypothetical protein